MKIVVDAMGGDHAPAAVVEGAVLAAREYNTKIILTGLTKRIQAELDKHDPDHGLPIEIVHAEQIVEMHDIPGKALRSKKKSSMKVGLDLVKQGTGGAFLRAGNTGAVLAYSTVILRPVKGVDRPAIAIQLPTSKGISILLDAGANVHVLFPENFSKEVMTFIEKELAPLCIGGKFIKDSIGEGPKQF